MNRLLKVFAWLFAASLLLSGPPSGAGLLKLKGGYAGGGVEPPADIVVTNTAQMTAAVQNLANSGKVICLTSAGNPYGLMGINKAMPSMTTVRSCDNNDRAFVLGIEGTFPTNYTIKNLKVATDLTRIAMSFRINGGTNIYLDNLEITDIDQETFSHIGGRIVAGSNIHITNNLFRNMGGGLTVGSANNVYITDNTFTDLYHNDSIQIERTSYLWVERNYFTNFFYDWPKEHMDAIQVFSTNATVSDLGDHMTFRDNLLVRGGGTIPGPQGIPFIGNELAVSNPSARYRFVTISGNRGYGMQNNGISCGNCQDFTITGNLIQAYTDRPSNINWSGMDGLVSGNTATGYQALGTQTNVTVTDNVTISPCDVCTPP